MIRDCDPPYEISLDPVLIKRVGIDALNDKGIKNE
jgi:hypothetical protein